MLSFGVTFLRFGWIKHNHPHLLKVLEHLWSKLVDDLPNFALESLSGLFDQTNLPNVEERQESALELCVMGLHSIVRSD
jgi:hypothetical protein